jgi:hypothetical protein
LRVVAAAVLEMVPLLREVLALEEMAVQVTPTVGLELQTLAAAAAAAAALVPRGVAEMVVLAA